MNTCSQLIILVELKYGHSFFRYMLKTDALIPINKYADWLINLGAGH